MDIWTSEPPPGPAGPPPGQPAPPPGPPPGPPDSRKRKFANIEEQGDYGEQLLNMDSLPYQKRKTIFQNKLKDLVDGGELDKARALIEEAHAKKNKGVNAQKLNWLVLAYVQAKIPLLWIVDSQGITGTWDFNFGPTGFEPCHEI